jgi:hypothetical protein
VAEHNLKIGRMVHFALDNMSTNPGSCRAAVVSRIWQKNSEANAIQLTVYVDGDNDYPGAGAPGVKWVTSVTKDQLGQSTAGVELAAGTPRTWHWPDECPRAD